MGIHDDVLKDAVSSNRTDVSAFCADWWNRLGEVRRNGLRDSLYGSATTPSQAMISECSEEELVELWAEWCIFSDDAKEKLGKLSVSDARELELLKYEMLKVV